MLLLPFHQRMAELWTIRKRRALTPDELDEMALCLEANMTRVWNEIKQKNLSTAAFIVGDAKLAREANEKLIEMREGGRST